MKISELGPARGTKDLFGDDYLNHQYVIDTAQGLANCYCYKNISTPIFEFTNIFARSMGETSDVVSKEMYSLDGRDSGSLTLRPEFTAGIVRSFLTNSMSRELPLKLFSHGPVFRRERPQSFRQRQFHQLNFESLGYSSSYIDAEIIAMAAHLLNSFGVLKDTSLELNSLGDLESRKAYYDILVEYFNAHKESLSEDSLARLVKNPLRILDSKDENDRKIVAGAPVCYDYYNDFSKDFFEKIKATLDDFGIIYNINPRLVRGLDYYTHTVFEFVTEKLGAQGTVLAGGRYDGLVKLMGGRDTPAIGFAAGIERLCGLINYKPILRRPIMIIAVGADMVVHANKIARLLRESSIIVEINYKHDVGKQMQKANDINASVSVFIGSEELAAGKVKIKDLDKREEHLVDLSRLIDYLQQYA